MHNKPRQAVWIHAAVLAGALAASSIFSPAIAGPRDRQPQPYAALAYVAVGEVTRPPIGWVEFCAERPWECRTEASEPRDVQLTKNAFKELERVNRFVNDRIKPMTDLEHYGVIEKWTYPEDGYGD